MRLRRDLQSNPKFRKDFEKVYSEKIKEEIQKETERILDVRRRKRNFYRKINRSLVTSESQPRQNLGDNDSGEITGNKSELLPVDSGIRQKLELNDFFLRPVLIDDFTLQVNTPTIQAIKPYKLWSDDPTVRAKLSHYTYLRGTLCVRIVLSATRFHFGSMVVSFQPYADSNQVLNGLIDMFNAESNSVIRLINNYLTQSPERYLIKFGADNSMEMRLPMLAPKQGVRLFNKDGTLITNSTPFEEFGPLGDLYYSTLSSLRVANDDKLSPVNIQTYAWMEDIELGPTTATDMNITAEAMPIEKKAVQFRDVVNSNTTLKTVGNFAEKYADDEYSDAGPVSKIASAVSNIAEKVQDIPVIGVAARATSMVAGKAAKILKFFGFSKPVQLEPLIFVKNLPYSNGALLENKDTSFKLTADPKQELSIQPIGGEYSMDPMAIKFLTSRESYFHSFLWSENDTPRTDTLAVFPVMPMIDTQYDPDFETKIVHQLTSLGYASVPFKHWRGTISFRFEVVASSFHRGKLMFIYEPNLYGFALTESNVSDLNQQYIYYLDIEDGRDLTIDCGFVYDRLFANVRVNAAEQLDLAFPEHSYTTADMAAYVQCAINQQSIGTLYVRPFTALTSPSTNADDLVSINCYVYSDDMEFNVPVNMRAMDATRQVSSESQPREFATEGAIQVTRGSNNRTSDTYTLINKVKPSNDNIYLYHFGEKIESFRALLKRDDGLAKISTVDSDHGFSKINLPVYPCAAQTGIPSYGNITNSATVLNSNSTYSLFDHLRYGYLFCKGGYRYKVYQTNPLQYYGIVDVDRTTFQGGDDQYRYADSFLDIEYLPKLSGSVLFNQHTNNGVEVEIPYYADNLFELCGLPYFEITDTRGGLFSRYRTGAHVRFEHTETSHSYDTMIVGHAAEDFTFFRFQGGCFYLI